MENGFRQQETWLEFQRSLSAARRTRPDGRRAAEPMPLVADRDGNDLSRPATGILVGLLLTGIVGMIVAMIWN